MHRFRWGVGPLSVIGGLLLFLSVGMFLLVTGASSLEARLNFLNFQVSGAVLLAVILTVSVASAAIAALYFRAREKHKSETRLERQNLHLNAVIGQIPQGISMFDGQMRLVFCNEQYARIYDLPQERVQPGTPFAEIRSAAKIRKTHWADGGTEYEDYGTPRTGVVETTAGLFVAITRQPVPGGGWLTTHSDITELRQVEQKIAHMARHDSLTGLPNRTAFLDHVAEAASGLEGKDGFALLCVNLDRFKDVNDGFGHPAGDEVLKAAAARLRRCLGKKDILARLGSDEFAVMHRAASLPNDAAALAHALCDAVKQPFSLAGEEVALTASIGVSVAPADGGDAGQLLKKADLALRKAKADGRGVYRFFKSGMDQDMVERRSLETALRAALSSGDFELYYQPLLSAGDETLLGVEALIRWPHAERGMIPPDDFIPLAEETGLIVPLGDWVIRRACADAEWWPEHVKISVNIAAHQFDSGNLVNTVINALSASRLSPSRLILEITETTLMKDSDTTLKALHMLRELGVGIAMDDFGTGYSSLSYLRSFPFDKIKIDRSFVAGLPGDAESLAITKAVASMGNSLGMQVTAEGVECEEQLKCVREQGYTEVQGFYYSPPRPAAEIAAKFLSEAKRASA